MDPFDRAFGFLSRMSGLEFGTPAGHANVIFIVLLTVGTFAFGTINALVAGIEAVFGHDSSAFPPAWAFITLAVLMVFCVSLLFCGEELKRRR